MPGNPNPSQAPQATAIEGVLIQPLRWYSDSRGSLSVLLRGDQEYLRGEAFGQAYVTTVRPGIVKAWHRHRRQWDRMVGLVGQTLLVLRDGRADSPSCGQTVQWILGDRHPSLVLIPPGVWHGLKALSDSETMVLNLPTEAYDEGDPDEERFDPRGEPVPGYGAFSWASEDG